MSDLIKKDNMKSLYNEIVNAINRSKNKVVTAVNSEMVILISERIR